MKITHNNKTYIDAATHAGLRCWINSVEVEAVESLRSKYPNESPWNPRNVGDWAKDELIRYAYDPDSWRQPADAILITDAEDHRKHWPLRNTHRHPLEAVGKPRTVSVVPTGETIRRMIPAPQPVDGGEWYSFVEFGATRLWNSRACREFLAGGIMYSCGPHTFEPDELTPITPTQAAEWLERSGHAQVAAEIRGRHG